MSVLSQEIEGSALLMATLEANGGDLRAAFALLCRGVNPEELAGEDFRAALSRAVTTLLERSADPTPNLDASQRCLRTGKARR